MNGPTRGLLAGALALGIVSGAAPVLAQASSRPTPHQAIERALAALQQSLRDAHATEAERALVADLLAQGETWASQLVEAQHRGDLTAVRARRRWLERLARTVRGRLEASRAEASAVEAERVALAAEERRLQARAALERVVERRIEQERGGAVSSFVLPPPDPVPSLQTTASPPPAPSPEGQPSEGR